MGSAFRNLVTLSEKLRGPVPTNSLTVVTAGHTVLFWFLQDSEGAQPLNLSAKPKASESKSPNSPQTSPQVPAAAAASKLGHAGSGKHSIAPSSIGGPPTRVSSIGKWTPESESEVESHQKLKNKQKAVLVRKLFGLNVALTKVYSRIRPKFVQNFRN